MIEAKKLKDVCFIKPPKKESKELLDESELVSFVPMADLGINQKYINLNEERELSKVYSGYTYFKENDVLLAKITPCFENGKLGIARNLTNGVGFGSSEYIVYRPKNLEELNNEYLYYFLNQESFREFGTARMAGAVGHKRIQKDFYEEYLIPMPKIEQQKQIVVILDKAFVFIEKAKKNIEKNLQNSKDLFDSRLNEIFLQKGDGWEEKKISEITKVLNGFSFKSTDFSSSNSIKSIKITNVGVNEFIENEDNKLPKDFINKYSNLKVYKNNLVIALTRTIISNGLKIAKVPESYDGALLNQRVASLISDESKVNLDFLYYFFSTRISFDYVLSNVNTLMQPNLSLKDLKNMPISMPQMEIQDNIVIELDNLKQQTKKLEEYYQQKLDNLEELKKSILQKAFSGELVA